MGFKMVNKDDYPSRQWALVAYADFGKTTFAAQMTGPTLVIDADHRINEVVRAGQYTHIMRLSDKPADNMDALTIARLLSEGMPGTGIKTIVIDSLTAIIEPLVVEAVMQNDAGNTTNRVAGFKDKALALRSLQGSVTRWGTDTLWIYHLRDGRDAKAREVVTASITDLELARLRQSLNMRLVGVMDGTRRGIKVEWARNGRDGMTLWDATGNWEGMPRRIEAAVYDGLTPLDQAKIAAANPIGFANPADAISWGNEKGIFRDAAHARNAYNKVKEEHQPATAKDMWALWIADVDRRIAESEDPELGKVNQ